MQTKSVVFYNLNENGQAPKYLDKRGMARWISYKNYRCALTDDEDIAYAESLVKEHKAGFVTEQEWLETVTPDNAFIMVPKPGSGDIKCPVSEAKRLILWALEQGQVIKDVRFDPNADKYVSGTAGAGTQKELSKGKGK